MVDPAAGTTEKAEQAGGPKSKFVYLRLKAEHYKGMDPGTGEFLNLIRGDVARVSPEKAAQLKKDFKDDFKPSSEAEYDRSEEDRSKRAAELEKEVREREKRNAAGERARAVDDDDDE